MSFDMWSWGSISAHASAQRRQCFFLQPGASPVASGRYRVAWLDDDGGVLAWWTGNDRDLTGGWGDERPLVLTTEDEAKIALAEAVRSFGDRRERSVKIVEAV